MHFDSLHISTKLCNTIYHIYIFLLILHAHSSNKYKIISYIIFLFLQHTQSRRSNDHKPYKQRNSLITDTRNATSTLCQGVVCLPWSSVTPLLISSLLSSLLSIHFASSSIPLPLALHYFISSCRDYTRIIMQYFTQTAWPLYFLIFIY